MIKTHYDAIPPSLLQGCILDVGCGDGSNQQNSKNWPLLQHATGIDIEDDVLKWESTQQYDTVLLIHVIEHIEQDLWKAAFERVKSWVKKNGWLVIGTPLKQDPRVYRHFKGPENQRHRVFNITHETLLPYLQGGMCTFTTYRGPFSMSLMCFWRKT